MPYEPVQSIRKSRGKTFHSGTHSKLSNQLMKPFFHAGAAIAAILLLTACGEDPILVKKHGEQQAEIAKLAGELALIEERMKNLPPDQSAALNKTAAESVKLEAERSRLSGEVEALEAEHRELLQKYEDYKRKYAIR